MIIGRVREATKRDILPRQQPGKTQAADMRQVSRILPLVDLPESFEDLRAAATEEGFRFVDKLALEWCSGANRFAQPGEVLLGAFQTGNLVAIGGLNHDPYADQKGIGRLRHVYVSRSARRSGLGAELVGQLLAHANGVFHSVRLRTQTQEAANFYVKLGFLPVQDESASHIMSAVRSAPGHAGPGG